MSNFIEIVSPGFQTTIQDRGRWGHQEYGVPTSGTVAPHWLELANALVGNPNNHAGLEFRVLGPTLKAINGAVKIAICGEASADILIKSETGTQTHKVQGWRSFTLNPGEEVKISAIENSAAGIIAFSGGIDVTDVMDSRSTYVRSEIGGTLLKAGDQLPLGEKSIELASQADKIIPSPPTAPETRIVRAVLGPQEDYFETDEQNRFFDLEFTISKSSDRMGARLEGQQLVHLADKGSEIVSDGVVPGAIQVPGTGEPIVLLNDGQTVGGYPKIATVISCDLHLIANALPGTKLCFEQVAPKEACLIVRKEQDQLQHLKRSIIAASADGFVNLKALYESNLVGGVVDMAAPDHFPGNLDSGEETL